MRLQLMAVTAAMLVVTTSAIFKVQNESSEPPLAELPGILELLGITDMLGLSGRLEVRASNLLQQESYWDKVRYGMAAAGVALAEVGVVIGYFGDFLRNKEKEELEAAMEAEAAAAEEEAEAEAEGNAQAGSGGTEVEAAEQFHSIMPYNSPTLPDYIKYHLANRHVTSHRTASQSAPHLAQRRPAHRRTTPPAHIPRPYPPRIYRRRLLLKRSAAATNAKP